MSVPEVIKIDDVEYVKKDSIQNPEPTGVYSIVRTTSAGVFAGIIKERNGMEVVLENARRLWYWEGAASLSQLSIDGVKCPDKCKFPEAVSSVILTQAIEILPMTETARKSVYGVKVWKI